MIDWILSELAPHICCGCGVIGTDMCSSCKYNIINDGFSECLFCLELSRRSGMCQICSKNRLFKQVWCAGKRRDELKTLLDNYKFRSSWATHKTLVSILDDILPIFPDDVVLVGVPTSSRTIRVRGFDHINIIIKRLAKVRDMKSSNILERSSNETLHFLGRLERKKLAEKLFVINLKAEIPKKVLLVDDITTTGTTLISAAKLLKKAGVRDIYAVVVAKQPLRRSGTGC